MKNGRYLKGIYFSLLLLVVLALFATEQVVISGRTKLSGRVSVFAQALGAVNAILSSNGSGSPMDSGCNNIGSGTPINCPAITFNSTRTVTSGGKTCPLFPDQYWANVDVSGYPVDQASSTYTGYYAGTGQNFTAASWSGGTASITVPLTAALTNGVSYFVSGAVTSTCSSGLECGYNSYVTTLGNYGLLALVTVVNGTHFTYPIASNPGTWSGGGTIWTHNVTFKRTPAMTLNLATNATATLTPSTGLWDGPTTQSDAGPYPWTSSFFVEGYSNTLGGGYTPQLVSTFTPGGDAHVQSINLDTCTLYETFSLQNNASPWVNANGAIWDLKGTALRSAKHYIGPIGDFDTSGLTSTDVAGLPIWPLVLQYSELYGGNPITHAIRITLQPCSGTYNGYRWPATHGTTGCTTTPPLGSRWILSSSFDTTTCHFLDCAGLAWPAYMQRLFTAMQKYGVVFADGGGAGIIVTTDADSSWGATDDTTSPAYTLEGYMHGIRWKDGLIVEPSSHILSITSGQLK